MKKYQILIMDLDDTLTDDTASCKYAYQKLLQKLSIEENEYPFSEWKKFDTKWWSNWEQGKVSIPANITTLEEKITFLRAGRFQKFFQKKGYSYQEYINCNLFYISKLGENIIRTPGSLEFLENNKEKMIIIMTNGPKEAAYLKLRKANLTPYINQVFSAEDCGYSKPMIEFFDYIKEKLQNNLENALMIGDSLTTDIQGGNLAGIDTAWYNPNQKENNLGIIPTYEFQTYEQLEQIININQKEKKKTSSIN